MEERTYTDQDWAVQRWDRFNGGKIIEPKSFCQFWRTVLLWSTLSIIPLFGKIFLTHLYQPSPEEVDRRNKKFDERMDTIESVLNKIYRNVLRPLGLGIWKLLWPLRTMLYLIWRGLCNIAAYIDEHKQIQNIFMVAGLIFLLGVVVLYLAIGFLTAWKAIGAWTLLLFIGIPVLFLIGTITLILSVDPLVNSLVKVLSTIGQIFILIWQVLVTSKHRVCPPMDIIRSKGGE